MNGKITVVMPAFNEASHIVSNVIETARTLDDFAYDYEIVVVDDGSPDNTYLHAAQLLTSRSERVRIVRYSQNCGKGNALMCGTLYARGDYVLFLDADMDLHPVQLPTFFGIMEASGADVVIGSKRHPLSRVDYPRLRRFYSWAYYNLIRALFGLPVKDTQTGMKLFRREVLEHVFPRILVKRFAFDIELLVNVHRLGYRIESAPVTLEFRRSVGRIRWRDVFRVLVDTAAIFYRMKIVRYYDRIESRRLDISQLPFPVRELKKDAHV